MAEKNHTPLSRTARLHAAKAKANAIRSAFWLGEAAFRIFAGWVLLGNFDHYATTLAALYALGTAGLIVVVHFAKAHK